MVNLVISGCNGRMGRAVEALCREDGGVTVTLEEAYGDGNHFFFYLTLDLPEDGTVPEGYEPKFIECVNPEILEESEDTVTLYEGCLSFPGHNGAIERPRKVKIRAQDRFGNTFEMEAEEMLARCFCHETNHLDGITIMDLADHFYEDDYPDEAEED